MGWNFHSDSQYCDALSPLLIDTNDFNQQKHKSTIDVALDFGCTTQYRNPPPPIHQTKWRVHT